MARGRGAKTAAFLLVGLALGTGCSAGRATRIGTGDGGGSVLLNGNNDRAWDQAQRLMASHCEGGFTLVRRGGPTGGVPDGRGAIPAAAVTPGPMDMGLGPAYGERIDYQCVMAAPPAPRPPPLPVVGPVASATAL